MLHVRTVGTACFNFEAGTRLFFVDGFCLHAIHLLFFFDVACCQTVPIETATMKALVDCVIDSLSLIQQLRMMLLLIDFALCYFNFVIFGTQVRWREFKKQSGE